MEKLCPGLLYMFQLGIPAGLCAVGSVLSFFGSVCTEPSPFVFLGTCRKAVPCQNKISAHLGTGTYVRTNYTFYVHRRRLLVFLVPGCRSVVALLQY